MSIRLARAPVWAHQKGREGEAEGPRTRGTVPPASPLTHSCSWICPFIRTVPRKIDNSRSVYGGCEKRHSTEANHNYSSINKYQRSLKKKIFRRFLNRHTKGNLTTTTPIGYRRSIFGWLLYAQNDSPPLSSPLPPPLPLACSTGHSLHIGRWRRTCSPGRRGRRPLPSRAPCGRCSTLPGRGGAPSSAPRLWWRPDGEEGDSERCPSLYWPIQLHLLSCHHFTDQ